MTIDRLAGIQETSDKAKKMVGWKVAVHPSGSNLTLDTLA